jgi:hypothetical protein
MGCLLGFIGPERHWRFEKEYERLFPDHTLCGKERVLRLLGVVYFAGFILCVSNLF